MKYKITIEVEADVGLPGNEEPDDNPTVRRVLADELVGCLSLSPLGEEGGWTFVPSLRRSVFVTLGSITAPTVQLQEA